MRPGKPLIWGRMGAVLRAAQADGWSELTGAPRRAADLLDTYVEAQEQIDDGSAEETLLLSASHRHGTGATLRGPSAFLAEALEASAACATICSSCADACLAEESVADLRDCIRTDLDCADVCAATAALLLVSWGVFVRFNRAAEELGIDLSRREPSSVEEV